jgi:deoxyribonuclease V
VDAAFSTDGTKVLAVAVVWDRISGQVVDVAKAARRVRVPYIPGFLSFREGPAVEAAIRRLKQPPGVWLFDGQGIAHPRECGIATHVGVRLDLRAIGVAKSRLIGHHREVPLRPGATVPLLGTSGTMGAVLRSRQDARPIYVSVGNRVTLPSAVKIVNACLRGRRLPEPTRLADRIVSAWKRELG